MFLGYYSFLCLESKPLAEYIFKVGKRTDFSNHSYIVPAIDKPVSHFVGQSIYEDVSCSVDNDALN